MKPETAISTDNVSRNEILPANEDDVFAASQVPAVDKKDKNKNKNKKNKDKNKNKKEDSINSAKFEHIANIAPAIEKNEVPDIILESPAPIDFDNQETQNADIESKNIIDDFGIKPSDNVADTEPNQDLSADDTPIDESIDIDLDEFFAAANGDDDDLPHTLPQPAADSVKSVDIEHTAPEAEVLPTSDETSFDEYTIDQPTDDLDAAFDLGSEQAEPEPVSEPASDLGFEFEVEDENDDTAFDIADETEAEPDIITEPEPEPEPEPDPEPEYETEDQAAPRPSVSYNSDYDSAMLKIKEALNSKDEVSLDDMDITPVSLSSDNSFSSLTNEEEDDLAQSFAELSNDTPSQPEEENSDEEEWEYVDENGNPIEPSDDDEWEYVDEDGNPVNSSDDEEWEYVDEDGNPVNPSDDDEWEYVDENGNTVVP